MTCVTKALERTALSRIEREIVLGASATGDEARTLITEAAASLREGS